MLIKSNLKLDNGEDFTLTGNKVLLECQEDEETYNGILVKPDKYKKYSRTGWIRAIGTDVENDEIAINDLVWFNAYTGVDLDINGKFHKVIAPGELLCVVEE